MVWCSKNVLRPNTHIYVARDCWRQEVVGHSRVLIGVAREGPYCTVLCVRDKAASVGLELELVGRGPVGKVTNT
jgi:hypothetical protein